MPVPAEFHTTRPGRIEPPSGEKAVVIGPIHLPLMQLVMTATAQRDEVYLLISAAFLAGPQMVIL
jgi:hypothetical protein